MYQRKDFSEKELDTSCLIRMSLVEAEATIKQRIPDCRERSIALTKLEETMLWSNLAINASIEED